MRLCQRQDPACPGILCVGANTQHILQILYNQFVVHSVMSDSLWSYGLQHTRLPCPSPFPGVCSNLCLLSWWCHPTISSPTVPFSSCLQYFPAIGSFPISWLFPSGGQTNGVSVSASVLPMHIQGWFPLELTGLISLQFKGLSRVFSSTQFESTNSIL